MNEELVTEEVVEETQAVDETIEETAPIAEEIVESMPEAPSEIVELNGKKYIRTVDSVGSVFLSPAE